MKPITPIIRPGAPILLVGEAPGEQEALHGTPFVGHSGQLLRDLLDAAGIRYSDCSVTNVFLTRPPNNDLTQWCVKKSALPSGYVLPPLSSGKYISPDYAGSIERLWSEIEQADPNLIILLGSTACWAVLGKPKISTLRGVLTFTSTVPVRKVLPTYHPAAVLRRWDLRPIVIADLQRGSGASHDREINRQERLVFIAEVPEDIGAFWESHGRETIAVDVETMSRQVSVVGISPDPSVSLVVPFMRRDGSSYWQHPDQEVAAWRGIRTILTSPVAKVLQNGAYDIQYLWRIHGIPLGGEIHDTMLLHHAMFPEMQKSLGFLGSIYTDAPSWKNLKDHFKTTKREDE